GAVHHCRVQHRRHFSRRRACSGADASLTEPFRRAGPALAGL
ncbi:hypothetical protein, partial [Arthrobacter sp. DR-2P]